MDELNRVSSDGLSFAIDILRVAGRRIMTDYGRVGSQPKGDFDLVTKTDTEIEQFIQQEIRRNFPDHGIIGEETVQATYDTISDYCWLIDPLDGTVNFALGIPFFCVSLALLKSGQPILGVIYDPVRDELFHAQLGNGSFVNDELLRIETNSKSSNPIGGSSGVLKWSARHKDETLILNLLEQFGKLRILGSQALHLCYVAAGRLNAAISWEARLWDDAAGALIAQEAGALYTDFSGQNVFPLGSGSSLYTGESIHSIAADKDTHQTIISLFTQAGFTKHLPATEEQK